MEKLSNKDTTKFADYFLKDTIQVNKNIYSKGETIEIKIIVARMKLNCVCFP